MSSLQVCTSNHSIPTEQYIPNLNFIPCTVPSPSLVDNQRISSKETYGIRVLAESKRVWHNTVSWVFGGTWIKKVSFAGTKALNLRYTLMGHHLVDTHSLF